MGHCGSSLRTSPADLNEPSSTTGSTLRTCRTAQFATRARRRPRADLRGICKPKYGAGRRIGRAPRRCSRRRRASVAVSRRRRGRACAVGPVLALGFRPGHALAGAFAVHGALELGGHPEHLEQHRTGWVGGIVCRTAGGQVRAFGADLVGDVEEVAQPAAEPVELGDQGVFERRPDPPAAAHLSIQMDLLGRDPEGDEGPFWTAGTTERVLSADLHA